MAIFDRTWYGRVLVERVEGFATEEEWKRAYQEINDMEAHLVKSGTIVLKFWMHIDKDEQEKRFKQRMETPENSGKLQMKTGATVTNGMTTKKQSMR